VRTDYSSSEVRRLAQRAKDAGQARRLLATHEMAARNPPSLRHAAPVPS
jgi:hypothetical protein